MPDISTVSLVNFRSKYYGWKKSCGTVEVNIHNDSEVVSIIESADKNVFMKGFLNNLYLRPSCYKCPARKSGSDITIGDYWGIQNIIHELDDDKGVSLVMINTQKGKFLYDLLEKEEIETSYADACASNPMVEKSANEPLNRIVFFQRWKNEKIISLIYELTRLSLYIRIRNKIVFILSFILRRTGFYSLIKSVLKKG
jgi:hypothetical protein